MMSFPDSGSSVSIAESPLESKRAKILCIDDDPNVSMAMQIRFRPLGVEVLRAYHGSQGIIIATEEKPDLIITDLTMPHGSGDDVVQCLKNRSDTRDIPIIVVTGEPDGYMKRKLRNLGVADYLTKPVEFDTLRAAVESIIGLAPPTEQAESF